MRHGSHLAQSMRGKPDGQLDPKGAAVLDDAVLTVLFRPGIGVLVVEQIEERRGQVQPLRQATGRDGQIGDEHRPDLVAGDGAPGAHLPELEAAEQVSLDERRHEVHVGEVARRVRQPLAVSSFRLRWYV